MFTVSVSESEVTSGMTADELSAFNELSDEEK
jgi:hypothetical protein